MPNDLYKKLIIDRITSFIKESKSINSISHNGLKGSIRETGIGKLLLPLLPVDWDIGKGKIIDSYGNQSAEIDLLFYFKKVFPAIFFSNTLGVYPIESCGFAFEIKSKSTASEIKSTIKKFNKLKTLKLSLPLAEPVYTYDIRPIRVYIALGSDLKNKSEFDRYKEFDPEYLDDPAIECLLIVNKGIWYFRPESRTHSPHWEYYKSDGNYKEVIHLFSLIINQLIQLTAFDAIDMRNYFLDIDEIFELKIIK